MISVKREARFLLVALGAVALLAGVVVLPYVNTLTLAVVIGITFVPVADWLRPRLRGEALTAFVTLLIALILVISPLAFFTYRAAGEALGLYERLSQDHSVGELTTVSIPLQRLAAVLPSSVRDAVPTTVDLGPLMRSAGAWVVDRIGSLFGVVTGLTLDLVLLLIGVYYVIKDGRRFVAFLVNVAPVEPEYEQALFSKLRASVTSVVRGSLVIAVIQGVAAGIGFLVFGVPNAALWGAATMVASLVPLIGTSITMVPAVVYLLVTGSPVAAVLLAAWGFVIVGLVDNLFRGQLMKRGLDVHPFFILVSVLAGLEFFGPIGFISGPLLLAVLAALIDIYLAYRERTARLDAPGTLGA